ncbi:hypothetical protein KSF_041060 [Reticulibacter mediterranei]|uniref:Uncharacterized protein n=1 Tax=Reticulibacter mediterranei TaxID=2778369 RepID=A0A8J3N371_9CHLR|nr:hypothetical protein KSF_041060 [Reticulibacter mediterranei]
MYVVNVSTPGFLDFNLIHFENCEEGHKTRKFQKTCLKSLHTYCQTLVGYAILGVRTVERGYAPTDGVSQSREERSLAGSNE